MARASEWADNDVGTAVDVLNTSAATFPGVQFAGWHNGNGGLPKVPVEDPAAGPTAYGVVALGQSVLTPAANNRMDEPCRRSLYSVQVLTSTNELHIRRRIFKSALEALATGLPSTHELQGQQWRAPTVVEPPTADSEYYAAVATVPYTAKVNT